MFMKTVSPDTQIMSITDISRGELLCLCRLAALPESSHEEIDRIYREISAPLPGKGAESRYLFAGNISTALYARRCYTLAEHMSFPVSILKAGWPHIFLYLETRDRILGLSDFLSYTYKKSSQEHHISIYSKAEHLYVLGYVCKLSGISLPPIDKQEVDRIIQELNKIPVKFDNDPHASFDDKSINSVQVSLGLNYPISYSDTPQSSYVQDLFAREKCFPEEILGKGKLNSRDVNSTIQSLYDSDILGHVEDILHFETPRNSIQLPPKEYFKKYSWLTNQLIELGLIIRGSIRNQHLSVEHAVRIIETYECELFAFKRNNIESNDTNQVELLQVQLDQAQAELRSKNRIIRKLETQSNDYAKNLEELYAYREMFFDMAADNDESMQAKNDETNTEIFNSNVKILQSIPFVFAGGHLRLTNKLKTLFPHAVFIGERGFDPSIIRLNDVIFIFASHISHSTYYRIIENSDRSKICFLRGEVNLTRVVANMVNATNQKKEGEE